MCLFELNDLHNYLRLVYSTFGKQSPHNLGLNLPRLIPLTVYIHDMPSHMLKQLGRYNCLLS